MSDFIHDAKPDYYTIIRRRRRSVENILNEHKIDSSTKLQQFKKHAEGTYSISHQFMDEAESIIHKMSLSEEEANATPKQKIIDPNKVNPKKNKQTHYGLIFVTSISRSGSSMLFHAIKAANKKGATGKNHLFASVFNKPRFQESHFPGPSSKVAIVFIYGNPIDIIKSYKAIKDNNASVPYCTVQGQAFLDTATKGLYDKDTVNPPQNSYTEMIERDCFDLERHFQSYLDYVKDPPEGYPKLIMVRYPDLWDYQEELNKELKLEIQLPKYRKRINAASIKDEKLDEQLEKVYGNLRKKIENTKPFLVSE